MRKIFITTSLLILVSAYQFISTVLKVTMLDNLGNIQREATVKLYKNEKDYQDDKNVVASGRTDEKGKLQFKDLEGQVY